MYEIYISWIQILLDELVLSGTAKTKLSMLAILYCREFVKKTLFNTIPSFHLAKSQPAILRHDYFFNIQTFHGLESERKYFR